MNAASHEIDVPQLMSAIRESALKKHPDLDTHTSHEQIPPGLLLHIQELQELERAKRQRDQITPRDQLTLSPEFRRNPNDTYHVNDLVQYHDRDFVRNAYRAILKREPDEAGFLHNLKLLQSGAFNKIDILASLRYSDEGKFNGVTVNGLRLPAIIRTLERVPVFGYVLQLVLAFVRLPDMVRSQREFQGYFMAQQLAVADYANYLNDSRRVTSNEFQQHRLKVTAQLQALDVSVNETLLPKVERLKNNEAKLLQLNDRLASMSETLSRTREQIRSLSKGDRSPATESRTSDELREWDKLYAAFEDQFRGSAEEVEERLRFYLPFLKELNADSKILDLGSGRGDWLKLLRKEGFKPSGVESNEVFAQDSRKKGLEVVHDDMMVHLSRQPDNSIDLITAFHLIEHLSSETLFRLLDEIKRTLKPGGRVFMETPSSENLVVAACNFYADPTHKRPVNPHTLMFVLKQKDFTDFGLQFLHPVDGSPFKECEGAEQLNMWLYGPRDVAVTARKAQ